MEKTARKPSADPVQEKLRQNKATWNKDVSVFINDLIHLKKTMNGWPSKFFKERSRIVEPMPADPATIIGSLAGDFQEITNRGNALVQEQLNYSQNRRKRQPKQLNLPLGQPATPAAPAKPEEAPKVDLTKQLSLPAVAALESELVKVAFALEEKYALETEASNPLTRFYTRLKTPTIGFGEGARVRQLRMTMLKGCVQTLRELKKLQKEIVKSSKISTKSSHNIMSALAKQWSAVLTNFKPYYDEKAKSIPTDEPVEQVAPEDAQVPEGEVDEDLPLYKMDRAKFIISDLKNNRANFGSFIPKELDAIIDKINAIPAAKKVDFVLRSNIEEVYNQALVAINGRLGTTGNSLKEIAVQLRKAKSLPAVAPTPAPSPVAVEPPAPEALETQAQAMRWLGKARHGLLPGSTSGRRLEIYRKIGELKVELNKIMNLLEKGLDLPELYAAIIPFDRGVMSLRKMVRSLYTSEYPNEAVPMPFF